MKEGQDLVAAGFAGLAGTLLIADRKRQELSNHFAAEYLERLTILDKYNVTLEEKQHALRKWEFFGAVECEIAGEGGILTAVWNLTGAYRLGVEFSLRKIPIRQETIEVCELFGLNPYRLYSGGCWLLASENGGRTVEELAEKGFNGAVIGRITKGISRIITDAGQRGFLNRPQPDELEKVIPDWKDAGYYWKGKGGSHEREDFGSDGEKQQDRYSGFGDSAGGKRDSGGK
jgi:hydrogenase maturation factor